MRIRAMEYRLHARVQQAIKAFQPPDRILALAQEHHHVELQPTTPTATQTLPTDCNSNLVTPEATGEDAPIPEQPLPQEEGSSQEQPSPDEQPSPEEQVSVEGNVETPSSEDNVASEQDGDNNVSNVFGIPCRFLLQHSLLLSAVEASHVLLARAVLRSGFDLHSPYCKRMRTSPIHLACFYGNSAMISLLAAEGVDVQCLAMAPDGTIKPALALAIRHDDIKLLEPLLPLMGRKSTTYTRTPLYLACEEGAYRMAEHLLNTQGDGDVNVADFSGQTPLMVAVRQNLQLVRLLLNNKANVDVKTPDKGRQCLHMLFCESVGGPRMFLPEEACEIAQELVARGADVNRYDVHLETPLSLLCGQLATELHQFTFRRFPYPLEQHHAIIRCCVLFLLDQGALLNMDNGVLPFNVVMNGVRAALEAMIGRSWTNVNDAKNFEHTMEFALELAELLGDRGANPDSFNVYLLSPLTQMFVQLHSCQYVKDTVWERVWPTVRCIFLLLLRLGARDCELREAFWRPPYHSDVISMVLNALPQAAHQAQLWGVCRHMRRQAQACESLQAHLAWGRHQAANPRTLKQLSRVSIAQSVRYHLKAAVSQLPLPSLVQDYIISFEDWVCWTKEMRSVFFLEGGLPGSFFCKQFPMARFCEFSESWDCVNSLGAEFLWGEM